MFIKLGVILIAFALIGGIAVLISDINHALESATSRTVWRR